MTSYPKSRRNADAKVYKAPGPRGTPLQFAWTCFHSPNNPAYIRENLKDIMILLMDLGADTDWTEPDGTIVNEATIRSWCALSHKQLKSQSEFDYAFCVTGWYIYRYPLYASQSEIKYYKTRRASLSSESSLSSGHADSDDANDSDNSDKT